MVYILYIRLIRKCNFHHENYKIVSNNIRILTTTVLTKLGVDGGVDHPGGEPAAGGGGGARGGGVLGGAARRGERVERDGAGGALFGGGDMP
jgi:hypothetical protein